MRVITSSSGQVETVTVRRTESSDAEQICELLSPTAAAVFGRVNVIYLLEKANLAVTLSTAKNQILAHAAFLDHPIGDLVDQASWEEFLQIHYNGAAFTPLNTLFLHLFVARSSFAAESAKEIIRTVFSAITELEYICLVTPYSSCLEPALDGIFEPMHCVTEGLQCAAFVCNRHNHCPRLHVRKARVEDLDDITTLLVEQTKAQASSYGPYFLADLIEAQDETNHVAVCENEGIAVGFMSVSSEVNLTLLNQCFELSPFDGLLKINPADQTNETEEPQQDQPTEENTEHHSEIILTQESNEVPAVEGPEEGSECGAGISRVSCGTSETEPIRAHTKDCTGSNVGSEPAQSPNAFCIQLFAIDKRFEMRSVDFLPYVFKVFPERDFCIISVPKLDPEFPLLQTFLRAAPRPFSNLPQELYIFHRTGLLKSLQVRVPVCDDTVAVQRLVENLSLDKALMDDLDMFLKARRDPDGTPIQAFVVEIEEQIVGIVLIRNEQDIEYIRANYNIENFVYFSHYQLEEHGQLCHFALHPTFQHYTKHILKEVLRLAHKSCLYYLVYPTYCSQQENNAFVSYLTAALKCMVPVQPRRQIIYPLEELGINAPSTLITKQQVPYALNHINRKLTLEPKVTVNTRIVVVGASDTGIAFLESLVFCPHLQFNNLTLISTHGLPDCQGTDSTTFLTTSHCYSERDYALLSLSSWVSVVTGKMTAIDRTAKHVQVSEGRVVPYDHLVLCTGQQYQIPCPTGIDISKWSSTSQEPDKPRCRKYTGHVPSNFFTLNDQHDCTQAYNWLLENFIEQDGNAVVYGDSIDMYSCVETLLCLGVRGSRIHVVHTPADKPQSSFKNSAVDQAVRSALQKKEVHVHHGCLLAQLNDGQHPEPLTAVSFTTDGPPLRLECAVFFNFSCKGVDFDAFKAINDACLVFDGRLVIDTAFHTNDCAIRAAGPLTKYSRRYYADQWSHTDFNSKEVGQELVSVLLPFFDPTLETPNNPAPAEDRLIPIHTQPKIRGGRLPGGYSYLHVAKPSIYTNTAPSADRSGREMVTGRVETGNYFHLQFNTHGLLEAFTCLSHRTLPVSNYLCLYGKHQLLLNHLYMRFDQDLIHDLYSYFRETWCMAIFHDRFADFEQEVRQIMESTTKVQVDLDLVSIPKLAEMIVYGTLVAAEEPRLYLNQMFKNSEGPDALKRSVLDYLKYNRYHLPMYAQARLL
ncbi:cilia- and flagella-associated protein 61 isoform X1 [Astyanax mexicanus]|uniref:Cilia- and flagella-associated protein 61 isoform X1 n=1 Tax=Astyanax mexicanus TaxID=7994 RepID=A0A8B9KCD0_ASTMX|nr:cilia- and flagella-associated protein 61 isoform X1 [Astyanax mexicanus]